MRREGNLQCFLFVSLVMLQDIHQNKIKTKTERHTCAHEKWFYIYKGSEVAFSFPWQFFAPLALMGEGLLLEVKNLKRLSTYTEPMIQPVGGNQNSGLGLWFKLQLCQETHRVLEMAKIESRTTYITLSSLAERQGKNVQTNTKQCFQSRLKLTDTLIVT